MIGSARTTKQTLPISHSVRACAPSNTAQRSVRARAYLLERALSARQSAVDKAASANAPETSNARRVRHPRGTLHSAVTTQSEIGIGGFTRARYRKNEEERAPADRQHTCHLSISARQTPRNGASNRERRERNTRTHTHAHKCRAHTHRGRSISRLERRVAN